MTTTAAQQLTPTELEAGPKVGTTHAANLRKAPKITPLAQELRSALPTPEAAQHLCRAQQTLRIWASTGAGPILPQRVHGRLLWPTDRIRQLLGVAQ